MDYLKIFREPASQIQKRIEQAIEWYKKLTSGVFSKNTGPPQEQSRQFMSYPTTVEQTGGNLFVFTYYAKWGHTLPYWDRRPLVFPIGPSLRHPGNFIGLNVHYLPPQQRAALFNGMRSEFQTGILARYYRMVVSYDKMVANPSNFPGFDQCIKEYIPGNISASERIDPRYWEHVVMLPSNPDTGPNWVVNRGSPPY